MKKFQFSLETMLGYRQQILELKQQDYATAEGRVMEQERIIHSLQEEFDHHDQEFTRKKLEGITVMDALTTQMSLEALEREMKKQRAILRKLQVIAEEKRQEMIQAKQDTSSAEKLREKKLEAYNKEVAKNEEAMIDELVAGNWSLNRE